MTESEKDIFNPQKNIADRFNFFSLFFDKNIHKTNAFLVCLCGSVTTMVRLVLDQNGFSAFGLNGAIWIMLWIGGHCEQTWKTERCGSVACAD